MLNKVLQQYQGKKSKGLKEVVASSFLNIIPKGHVYTAY